MKLSSLARSISKAMILPRRNNFGGWRNAVRRLNVLRGFVSLAIGFLFVLAICAERLPVKTYTVADGLLRDQVSRVRRDSRGFLWFCTADGVSRFDGAGMTNFTTADGLPDHSANDFLETKNGTIYIATDKGLARLDPQGTRVSKENPLFTVLLPNNERAVKIQILYQEAASDQIWVGTSDGLYKLIETSNAAGAEFEPVALGEPLSGFGGAVFVPSPNTLSVTAIRKDRRGVLWVGTYGSGLFRLSADGGIRRFHKDADGFGDNKITALLEDREGRIWMGMRADEKGGVCLLDAADDRKPVRNCYQTKDGLPANRIRDIFEASNGQVWLATAGGLCRWREDGSGSNSVCITYTAENDLCDQVYAIAEDKDGNLWTGSPCGAKKIARYGFTTYREADGLDYNWVNAMFENQAGELFATSFPKTERVISRFDGEKFSSVKPRLPDYVNYHGYGWQQTVFQDSRGAWWIPTGAGLFCSPDKTSFENLEGVPLEKQATGAKGSEAFRLFEDLRGDVWMATTSGGGNDLLRWERAKNIWHDHTAQAGISDYRVGTAFAEDRHGNVWIGASSDHGDGALVRYRPNGEFRVFTKDEGAPSSWTSDLFLDSRGRLWIATDEDGLLRLDETNSDRLDVKKYTPADGLTGISTICVTEDEFGRIYVATWRGIDRLTPETGQIESFTSADGLPNNHTESSYRDRNNNLWFMTENGLARFVPEPPRTRAAPTILLTGLRVEGLPQAISILGETEIPVLDLDSDERQISVDFLGLGLSLGENLRYEYRLNSENWTPTAERTVNFANLASDDYRFEVRAQSADRVFSPPAVFSFRIAVPLWQRWWFIALTSVFLSLAIYSIYRYRLTRLLEMERTRTRIATDLHDDIGTNLSKISLLSEIVNLQLANQNTESNRLLNSIAEISRESVSSMSDIVWAINPKRDSALELVRRMRLHVEEVFLDRNVNVRFNAPEEDADAATRLSMDVRRDLYLIFKEAVSNAARHSDCKNIEIDFRLENAAIFLQVADDGKGFLSSQKSDGNGLENLRTRAEKNGGKFEIESDEAHGTILRIRFPQN